MRIKHNLEVLQYAVTEQLVRVAERLGLVIRHRYGPKRFDSSADGLVVLSLLRNAQSWLPTFFRHYREMGVRRFVLLDNGSEDATVEIAAEQPGVAVYSTSLPFKHFQIALRRWMISRFSGNGWALMADADELFDYPFSDRLSLDGFLEYLDAHGYTAVSAQVLDLFSSQSLNEIQGKDEGDLREVHKFYDLADVTTMEGNPWLRKNEIPPEGLPHLKGGVRGRVFGTTWATLTKHPLIKGGEGVRPFYDGPHFVAGARFADVTGLVRHYKFTSGFADHTRRGVEEGQYYRNSRIYRRYDEVFSRKPDLGLVGPNTEELDRPEQLLDSGFLVASERYRDWALGVREA